MYRTRIKICGVCRPEDAMAAARCGADAVGLVFHSGSPRNISEETAHQIIAALPAFVSPVALFVNSQVSTIIGVARSLGVRHVQLHGDEGPEEVAELSDLAVLKVIHVRSTMSAELRRWREGIAALKLLNLKALVLDTDTRSGPGGTGEINDWNTLRQAIAAGTFNGLPPIIAAGGLRPENVGDVVRTVQPWAVDVSSGVEEAVGRKSEDKMRAFVNAVRGAE